MMPLLTIIVAGFWEAIVREVVWLNARSHQVSLVISISHSFSNKRSGDAIAGEGFGENQFPEIAEAQPEPLSRLRKFGILSMAATATDELIGGGGCGRGIE
jgi:hypothetical protein